MYRLALGWRRIRIAAEVRRRKLASSVFIPTAVVVSFRLLFHNYVLAATCINSGICLLKLSLSPRRELPKRKKYESKMNVCYVKREVN